MANIAYVRVSTVDQNEARQLESLKKYNIDKWFIEKSSGKNIKGRPEFKKLQEYSRDGDVIFIHDLSRLARNTKDLLTIIEDFEKRNIRLVSNKENFDTSTPTGKLMLTMIAAINEFERTNLLERQREGIEIAKEKGIYKGRKKTQVENIGLYYNMYMSRQCTKVELAKQLGILRPTLDRLFKNYEKQIKKSK